MRSELDRAHDEIERQRTELAQVRTKATTEVDAAHAATEAVRAELVKVQAKADAQTEAHAEQGKQVAAELNRITERLTKAEADRETARKESAAAREAAARSDGQLEEVTAQNATLLFAIQARQVESTGKKD